MHGEIEKLISMLESKSWRPTSPIEIPSKPEDFDLGGKSIFADMRSPSGNILQMNLRDYGEAPKQESYILKLDPSHKPAAPSRTYLLQVTVYNGKGSPDYGDLIYPRRIFETGDPNKELPLRYWVENPDWTPQKAGMVPIPPRSGLALILQNGKCLRNSNQ